MESTLVDLVAVTGRTDRTKFRNQVLASLIEKELIEMTIPDKTPQQQEEVPAHEEGPQRDSRFQIQD